MNKILFTLVLSLGITVVAAQDMKAFNLYNPYQNVDSALQVVYKKAAAQNKHVFIQIGGNWCVWCARYNEFVTKDTQIDSLVNANYIVYHLNYSPENKNSKTLAKLGFPQRFGFPVFIILDGITDIRNIGAIARSAFCFGVNAIIIPDKGVGSLNEDAILTSAGALENIAVCRVNSLMKAVDDLHMNGIKVFASEMKATKKVYELNFDEPCAIVMGGEEHGVYPALLKICDEQFQIPMPGDFDSLNVSVATGVVLYEVSKQRAVVGN